MYSIEHNIFNFISFIFDKSDIFKTNYYLRSSHFIKHSVKHFKFFPT